MSMTQTVAQLRITREIQEAESALNEALIRQSSLFTTLVTARRDTGVNAVTGQDALLRLTKSQQALLGAGGDLARVHSRLLQINREVMGGVDGCPDPSGLRTDFSQASAA